MTQGGPFLVATPWSHHAGKRHRGGLASVRLVYFRAVPAAAAGIDGTATATVSGAGRVCYGCPSWPRPAGRRRRFRQRTVDLGALAGTRTLSLQICRSVEHVRSVRRNPYPLVSVLPGVRKRRHGPAP